MAPKFSLVIPVFNEQESIKELLKKIQDFFKTYKATYEIAFVDDGSNDKTTPLLEEVSKKNSHIKFFSFRKNLGKSAALTLGFSKSQGDYVATLDADLQDDPSNLEKMHAYLEQNNLDMVTGWRKNRKDSPFKIFSSKIFNKLVSILFGIKIHDLNSGLKLYKREVTSELRLYGGMHRFIPVVVREMGFRIGEIPTLHHSRKYGKSKYKFTKIFTDVPDLITIYFLTKYNRRPLHFFGKVGSALLILGVIPLLYLTFLRFQGETIGDRPLLLFGILLVIAGVQTVFTGLIADLMVNLSNKERIDYPMRHDSTKI